MKQWIIIIVVAVLFGLACGVIGRLTTPTETITIREEANLDSLAGVLLAGKIDSAIYADLQGRYEALRNRPIPRPPHSPTIPHPTDSTRILEARTTLDTSVAFNATIMTGFDTTRTTDSARVEMDITYLGAPLDLFILNRLKITLPLSAAMHQKDPSITFSGRGLAVKILAGIHGASPGLGAGADIGPVEIGALYHTDNEWTFIAGWRLDLF